MTKTNKVGVEIFTLQITTFPNLRATISLFPDEETTSERADFNLQMLMFVTTEKERRMITIFFFPVFVSCYQHNFKLRWADRVQALKALTTRPGRQLFPMQSL